MERNPYPLPPPDPDDWNAPIPRRRRPVGLLIGLALAAMLGWEAA